MKNIILCDIDGTIANNDHRQHFLQGKKDWDGFFSELINDKPIHSIIDMVNKEHADGKEIVFLTGRPERYRSPTVCWLEQFFDFELKILMRLDTDKRNKIIIKRQMINDCGYKDKVAKVYENDEDLINLWNEMSLSAIDIKLIINN